MGSQGNTGEAWVNQRLLTVQQAAKYLGIHTKRLYASTGPKSDRHIKGLKCIRVGGSVRFDKRELDRWIDEQGKEAASKEAESN